MAENSKIEWCHHTFNPWIGCQKVSAGCDNCYAEAMMDTRYRRVKWGPHGERVRTSAAYWKQPSRWAKAARAAEIRPRVFCASLADVFDNQVDHTWRIDLFDLIGDTPELDWLLLTKRPENIGKMLPTYWSVKAHPNVWIGTTCEDQSAFDRRWPILQKIPARARFISYEPAIGPLRIFGADGYPRGLSWLICGGESGAGYRAMDCRWANDVRMDCERAGIPFFMKQMAGKKPIPPELMVRQFPVGP